MWAGITVGYSRDLVTKNTVELVDEALRSLPEHGTRPAVDVRLPGRVPRSLPDWAHRTRVDLSYKPSTQLVFAAEVLRRWGWQNRPHKLRDWRGRRCICGAICTAVPLMSRPWKDAITVADLGIAMADWLDGRIATWTGYLGTRPDDETRHLILTLTAACCAGFVATGSQPGHPPVRGYDGHMYRQRAFVDGWVVGTRLLDRIRSEAG